MIKDLVCEIKSQVKHLKIWSNSSFQSQKHAYLHLSRLWVTSQGVFFGTSKSHPVFLGEISLRLCAFCLNLSEQSSETEKTQGITERFIPRNEIYFTPKSMDSNGTLSEEFRWAITLSEEFTAVSQLKKCRIALKFWTKVIFWRSSQSILKKVIISKFIGKD